MRNQCKDERVVGLIKRAFDEDGMLVSKDKRKNQREARELLASGIDVYGQYVGDWDAHNSLLIIAYPNRTL